MPDISLGQVSDATGGSADLQISQNVALEELHYVHVRVRLNDSTALSHAEDFRWTEHCAQVVWATGEG